MVFYNSSSGDESSDEENSESNERLSSDEDNGTVDSTETTGDYTIINSIVLCLLTKLLELASGKCSKDGCNELLHSIVDVPLS